MRPYRVAGNPCRHYRSESTGARCPGRFPDASAVQRVQDHGFRVLRAPESTTWPPTSTDRRGKPDPERQALDHPGGEPGGPVPLRRDAPRALAGRGRDADPDDVRLHSLSGDGEQGVPDARPTSSSRRASPSDPNLQGLPLIVASTDPTRDVATAARLITNLRVANRVAKKVDTGKTARAAAGRRHRRAHRAEQLPRRHRHGELPQSMPRRVANAFAQEATDVATQDLHNAVDKALPSLQGRRAGTLPSDAAQQPDRRAPGAAPRSPTRTSSLRVPRRCRPCSPRRAPS